MYGIKRGQEHPHLGATSKIIRMKDRSYGVEVTIPGAFPATITGLATQKDAERWIERHKNEIATWFPQRIKFNPHPKTLAIRVLPEPTLKCVASSLMPPSSAMHKSPVVVLAVEDEEVIRTLAEEFMADAGFEVIVAADADTAVHLLQTQARRIHVLFTDVIMPGAMDGLMLAHH